MEQHIKEMISNFMTNQEARMTKLEQENKLLKDEILRERKHSEQLAIAYENKLSDVRIAVSKDLNEMSSSLEAHLTHSGELLSELERLTTRLK